MFRIHRSSVLIASLAVTLTALPTLAQDSGDRPDRPRRSFAERQGDGDRPRGRLHDRRERHRHALEQFDTNGDGKLSDAEREAARQQMKSRHDERKAQMQARLDTDGDGTVSEAEKAAGLAKLKADHPEAYARLVERLDTDGDGEVSPAEMEAGRDAHREKMDERREQMKQRHQEVLEQFDTDGDGKLNDSERQAARQAHREQVRQRVVQRFDTDGDGSLSQTEKAAAFDQIMAKHPERLGARRAPGVPGDE